MFGGRVEFSPTIFTHAFYSHYIAVNNMVMEIMNIYVYDVRDNWLKEPWRADKKRVRFVFSVCWA